MLDFDDLVKINDDIIKIKLSNFLFPLSKEHAKGYLPNKQFIENMPNCWEFAYRQFDQWLENRKNLRRKEGLTLIRIKFSKRFIK